MVNKYKLSNSLHVIILNSLLLMKVHIAVLPDEKFLRNVL